jgi:CII-binding regulator of phage lambda lysogenization HflD
MKKRSAVITVVSAAIVIALVIFVQPVQSFAANVLSALRVQDVHAINISLADIDQLAQSAQQLQALQPDDHAGGTGSESVGPGSEADNGIESQAVSISSTRQFKAFDFLLPHSLSSETPELSMIDSKTQTVTINTQEINGKLSELGAQPLPDSLDGSQFTVQSPAAAIAKYADNMLIETQMPVFSGDEDVLTAVKQSVLSLPQLTENLSEQLAAVDLTSGTMYVPVIEGFGQQTMVGNSMGYLYTISDLKTLLGSLPSGLLPTSGDGQSLLDKLQNYNDEASALIWTNQGVLYVLAGNQTEGDLVQIAGSVK